MTEAVLYELRLREEFQRDILQESYLDLRYTRVPKLERRQGIEYVEIYRWIDCSTHDSPIHDDLRRIDEEFLLMAVELGSKLFQGGNDVTREYRVKLI